MNRELLNRSSNFIDNISKKYNYFLKEIKIDGVKFIDKSHIQTYFKQYKNKSIFFIPIQEISSSIRGDNWINSVKISSNYRDTILVEITESLPIGIYNNGHQNILFNNKFEVLEIINKNNSLFNSLITFKGNSSIIASEVFFENIPVNFTSYIKEAIYINNRRWDLILRNNILLKLSENNIIKSLQNYDKIYKNFSKQELLDIESIDLRITEKAILKFKINTND